MPTLITLLLQAEDPTLRYSLIQILSHIGDPAAVEPVRRFADDPNHHMCEHVWIALARLTGEV